MGIAGAESFSYLDQNPFSQLQRLTSQIIAGNRTPNRLIVKGLSEQLKSSAKIDSLATALEIPQVIQLAEAAEIVSASAAIINPVKFISPDGKVATFSFSSGPQKTKFCHNIYELLEDLIINFRRNFLTDYNPKPPSGREVAMTDEAIVAFLKRQTTITGMSRDETVITLAHDPNYYLPEQIGSKHKLVRRSLNILSISAFKGTTFERALYSN